MPSNRTLLDENVPLADAAPLRASIARRLDWALFSAVDRIPLAKCWYCIRCNVSRAVSLMLKRGLPCGCCFYWNVCCRWCLSRLDEITCLTAKLLLVTLLRPNTWQNPARRIKEMLAILQNRFVVARLCDHRSSVSRSMIASRALGREKWNFLCFLNFI